MKKIYDLRSPDSPGLTRTGEVEIRLRLSDLPPSIMAALWHDGEWPPEFHDVLAQAYYENVGDDIAEYYTEMVARIRNA